MGPRKPSEGKTNKFSIELSKDGKVQRKKLQIQVYGQTLELRKLEVKHLQLKTLKHIKMRLKPVKK